MSRQISTRILFRQCTEISFSFSPPSLCGFEGGSSRCRHFVTMLCVVQFGNFYHHSNMASLYSQTSILRLCASCQIVFSMPQRLMLSHSMVLILLITVDLIPHIKHYLARYTYLLWYNHLASRVFSRTNRTIKPTSSGTRRAPTESRPSGELYFRVTWIFGQKAFISMNRLLLVAMPFACCMQMAVSNFDLYMNETETSRLLGKYDQQ